MDFFHHRKEVFLLRKDSLLLCEKMLDVLLKDPDLKCSIISSNGMQYVIYCILYIPVF